MLKQEFPNPYEFEAWSLTPLNLKLSNKAGEQRMTE
jgi:hypothetical protein